MTSFKKLGIILCSIGLFSNPSFGLEDKVMGNMFEDPSNVHYTFGHFTGQLTTICGFYKFGLVSEDDTQAVFNAAFQSIDEIGFSKKNKELLLAFGDEPQNSKCKKFFVPND